MKQIKRSTVFSAVVIISLLVLGYLMVNVVTAAPLPTPTMPPMPPSMSNHTITGHITVNNQTSALLFNICIKNGSYSQYTKTDKYGAYTLRNVPAAGDYKLGVNNNTMVNNGWYFKPIVVLTNATRNLNLNITVQ